MTSLRDFAKLLNAVDDSKLDHTGAKRRLANIGAAPEDLKNHNNIDDLVAMCSDTKQIWKMYKDLKDRANGIDPVENERIKQLEFHNAELRKAVTAITNVIGEQTCK